MTALVTREDHGRATVLTLNNPPANGYSLAMHRALDAHVVDLRMDPGCDVIVLRGAGDRFFCAGADIGYLAGLSPDEKYAFCLFANETLLRIENTPKLVIAALNGHCVGGGLEIALACDIRIGRSARAGKPDQVGLPEVSLGVLPGTGGTQRLTRVLGRARALQWMVEGRKVPMEEARAVGLVHEVLPEARWFEQVLEYARSFCRPDKAAQAVGLIKRAVLGGAELPLEGGLALERELQMRLFTAPDAAEGLAAFLEKRAPRFIGSQIPRAGASGIAAAAEAAPPSAFVPAPLPHGEATGGGSTVGARPLPDGFEGFEDFADFGDDALGSAHPSGRRHETFGDGEPLAHPSTGPSPTPASPSDAPWVDLMRVRIPDDVLNLLPRDVVERFLVVPIERSASVLLVALADPRNDAALSAVREETGLEVRAVRADELALAHTVALHYRA